MSISRRRFVQGTAIAAGAAALPLGMPTKVRGANEQLRVGVIGMRGRGQTHVDWVMDVAKNLDSNIRLVALADADEAVLNGRVAKYESKYSNEGVKLAAFKDFRKMLERDDIDVICIATPNHWHSLMGIMAMEAGKDVYCEKPVSHNVWEGRQLVNAARKYGKICQTGTQIRSSYGVQEMIKYVQSGQLGKIKYVHALCFKPRNFIGIRDTPLQIPDNVDYDLWCGPAAKRDLYRNALHYDWHWDFNTGNGDLGNQGIHQMDVARWFLGEDALAPRVIGIGGRFGYEDASDTPNTEIVLQQYEKAPLIFEVRGLPKDKASRHARGWGSNDMDHVDATRIGVLVYCEGGVMINGSYSSGKAVDHSGKTIKSFNGGGEHMGNFFESVRTRDRSTLTAEILEGHLSSALCHTGNISYQLGEKLSAGEVKERIKGQSELTEAFGNMNEHLGRNEVDTASQVMTLGPWLKMDPKTETFIGNDKANALLSRNYRQGYVVPDLSAKA